MPVADEPVDVLDSPDAGAKVIRGGAIRGFAYVATIALTASVVPLMTRHLGVVDFGRFVVASSVVMIVAGLTEFGLNGIGTREYALASPPARRELLANLLGLRTALTGLGLAVATLLMVAAGYPQVVILGMLISGVGLLLLNAQQTYSISLTAELNWGIASMLELLNSLVVAVGTVLLVVLGAQLLPFFFVSVVSSAAALVASMLYLRRHVSLLPRFDLRTWRRMAHDALPYAAAVSVAILYPRVGLIAVSLLANGHQAGYYSTAYKVVEVIGGTSGLIAGSAFPIFARAGRDDHDRLRYALDRVSITAMIVGTYVTISLVVAAPFVIAVLGGPEFAAAVPVLQLQAVALLGGFLAGTWSYALLSLREHGSLLRVTGVALFASIVFSLALVPSLGARGASIASAGAEFVAAGGYLLALVRGHSHLRPSFGVVPKIVLAGAIALVSLVLPIPSVGQWAIASVLYLGVLALARAFPHELLDVLMRHGRSG